MNQAQTSALCQPDAVDVNTVSYSLDNVSDSDPDDDENATEGAGPNPDIRDLKPVPGYESVVFNNGPPVPPPAYEPPSDSERPQEIFDTKDGIGEEAVRAAILAFVDKHCCYGSRPAKNMTISKITLTQALHYFLETFNETRMLSRKFAPYRGGGVDGPLNGTPPPVWSMECHPNELFVTHEKHLEVPHTSYLKTCHRCIGSGFIHCGRCQRQGTVLCSLCNGKGETTVVFHKGSHRVSCGSCDGSGNTRCIRCKGDGRVTCSTCHGFRTIRHYIQLSVSYVNNLTDYILERTDMPVDLIRDVGGQVIFKQVLPFVWPISHSQFPVEEVNQNSIRIVEDHRTAWPNARIIQQRQTLRSVPVTEAHYDWKDVSTRFWVYGDEHKVHAPDYSHHQFNRWSCNIL